MRRISEKEVITWSDLSLHLKFPIVGGWMGIIGFVIGFLVGW